MIISSDITPVLEAQILISLSSPITVLSVTGDIEDLLGFKADDFFTGQVSLKNRIHAHDHDIADDLFSIDTNRTPSAFNIRIRQANGRIRCIKGYYIKEPNASRTDVILKLLLQDAKSLSQSRSRSLGEQAMIFNFKAMMENTNDYIYFKDSNHVFTGASQTLVTITEPTEHWTDLIGLTDYDVFAEEYADIYYRLEKQVFSGILIAHEEQEILDNKGNKGWVDNRKYPIKNECGEIVGLFGIARDITERKKIEADLRIAATVFESQEGMLISDGNNVILRVNRAFTKITGYSAEEVIGKNPRILQSGRQDTVFYAAMWQGINDTGAWEGEVWNRRKNGEIFPEHLTITAVKDQDGIVTNYVATLFDITLSKAAADEIEHLAFYDPLTGLPNRRLLMDRLKPALASSHRSGRKCALLFIDLDNFKTLNDTLGHDIGDLLLQQVAERLTSCVREVDTVARLGGDEFVVMLEDLSEQATEAVEHTEIVGNKILSTLNQPYLLATHDYHSTPSIGAILFNGYEQTVDELLKQADIAMYHAKASGRNTLRFFDQQMQAGITARVALEADLRQALAENQFEIYYQLQISHNSQVVGAEALIRWRHPQRGLVSPTDFIPLAEENGLILPIGHWVLETACAQLKAWEGSEHTRHLQLAVNVSARQFRQPDFVAQVNQTLRSNAINPNRIKLELTESLVLEDIDDTIVKMNALRNIGVHISMDDFGTGHSSLSSLRRLPLDQLKIDQSFVSEILSDPNDAVIVKTIIAMANSLGIEVIAEGVETEAQRAFLEQHYCSLCQGYLFSEPVPIELFEQLLKRG
jgi:diguanylate cyclase (GGDEF)-like protein/PAS domain S-box-containing protein